MLSIRGHWKDKSQSWALRSTFKCVFSHSHFIVNIEYLNCFTTSLIRYTNMEQWFILGTQSTGTHFLQCVINVNMIVLYSISDSNTIYFCTVVKTTERPWPRCHHQFHSASTAMLKIPTHMLKPMFQRENHMRLLCFKCSTHLQMHPLF